MEMRLLVKTDGLSLDPRTPIKLCVGTLNPSKALGGDGKQR